MKTINSLLVLFVVLFLFSCNISKPTVDSEPEAELPGNPIISLVPNSPESALPFKEYCRRDDRGFIMLFHNSGGLKSSEIQGTITFEGNPPLSFTIPEIPAREGDNNGSAEVIVQIPTGCFNPDCSFSIQWSNQPAHDGKCIG